MHPSIVAVVGVTLLIIRLLLPFIKSTLSPLRSAPGPIWARATKIWFLQRVKTGSFHSDNIELHRKYGPVVRVCPDHYSIDDPSAIKIIYGINSKWAKSDWYEGWKHPSPERWTLFPDRNIERHAKTRRLFQGMYSLSSLVTYESYVDECASIFSDRMSEFAKSGKSIDMLHWFQCYAFDVIGDITYSKRFGFLDAGEDVAGTMAALQNAMEYSSLVGIYASWHPFLYKIMERMKGSGAAGRTYLMGFVQKQITQRKADLGEGKTSSEDVEKAKVADDSDETPRDFLSKIMQARSNDPEKVSEYHIFMMGLSNIIAGSDTTAVSLSAILYYLLKYPETLQKLRDEIAEFEAHGRLGKDAVKFKEAQEMPYFQAVMKEALRLHPATGLPLWRVVPESGAEVSGRFFPAGTVIGVNTWVAHANEDIFGKDAAVFRPERWIEAEKQGPDALKRMDAYYFPFGLGSRTCLGRHISILEMSKLIPQILRRFDFELVEPNKEWKTKNFWFVKPVDFNVRIKARRYG